MTVQAGDWVSIKRIGLAKWLDFPPLVGEVHSVTVGLFEEVRVWRLGIFDTSRILEVRPPAGGKG